MSELGAPQLHSFEAAEEWIRRLGVDDPRHAYANLVNIAGAEIPSRVIDGLLQSLENWLPTSADAGMTLNNLDRYLSNCPSRTESIEAFLREPQGLHELLRILGTSQYFSDLIIAHPEEFERLRQSGGAALPPVEMRRELFAELDGVEDSVVASAVLRRFRQRQILRIGYGDMIVGQSLEVVVDQISHLADVILDGALAFTRARIEERIGIPLSPEGRRCQFVVVALGKLGGGELNYSSDIDVMFLYECEGLIAGKRSVTHQEFFARLGSDLVKLISEFTEQGAAYRVDLRLRPEGHRGPVAISVDSAYAYYDLLGRTWERQALIKARPAAGDLTLGRQFLFRLETWIYRRYLNFAEISGIKALKRRIEARTAHAGDELVEVKTGRGGIRDVEFCTQFLQLLNGGDLPQVRTGSTLAALERLADVGCLTLQEHAILADTYRFLRKTEHRLQMMFDLQTHRLPREPRELQKLALRMGYRDTSEEKAGVRFSQEYRLNTHLNRTILNHLLHEAFREDEQQSVEPEVDLVLDPNPDAEVIKQVLGRYHFRNIDDAYRNLMQLSRESIPFLSTPRCRHFLASIAPRLLQAISQTPDPDRALVNLANVSESLGGKAVLWELFSFNSPSLKLYVDLCAGSQFLTDILISNPGMIDELMDSLVLNQPRDLAELRSELHDLCRGAEDPKPTLQGFKNTEILRVGVRDILGKNDLQDTLHSLSHVAEAILHEIALLETQRLRARWGQPLVASDERRGGDCRMAIVALGKLGSRELNYHSDLDVIFLYEADGQTDPSQSGATVTSNMHFFSELAQRIIRTASETGPYGRLYEVDPRLRPTGRSGSIVLPITEFVRYFSSGEGQLWERQALLRARVIFGEPDFADEVASAIHAAAFGFPWRASDAHEILAMRRKLEQTGGTSDLKRGPGGLMDVEFLVQTLQLRHGGSSPSVCETNTSRALRILFDENVLSEERYNDLGECYRFLGEVTKQLRLMYNSSRGRLPDEPPELDKLARRLGYATRPNIGPAQTFLQDCQAITKRTRTLFNEILNELARESVA